MFTNVSKLLALGLAAVAGAALVGDAAALADARTATTTIVAPGDVRVDVSVGENGTSCPTAIHWTIRGSGALLLQYRFLIQARQQGVSTWTTIGTAPSSGSPMRSYTINFWELPGFKWNTKQMFEFRVVSVVDTYQQASSAVSALVYLLSDITL